MFPEAPSSPLLQNLNPEQLEAVTLPNTHALILAGAGSGKTPFWGRLRMFKAIYYGISLANFRRTWDGWKRHRMAIRDVGALKGETILKTDGS